jgi:hypothetical protein
VRLPDDTVRNISLAQLAGVGFVIGVLFHACVVLAVLDDGQPSSADSQRLTPALPGATPTATALADRTNCEEIRGTDYRSEQERQWFRTNCT